jgi:2-polyprenyl-3-methyl-5-hydroxy-6-metoxy-1,4-benzoquinol methylase
MSVEPKINAVSNGNNAVSNGSNGAAPRTPEASAGPERFDPRGQAGKLIDAEHRGRYWWATQSVAGCDVLDAGCGVGYGMEILAAAGAKSISGVDIDEGAVGAAQRRFEDHPERIIEADLRDLPLVSESFDVVVCFETIEHMEEGERAIEELHRVLRPGGLLLISSPNPDVYPPGNEHHIHEYRPEELAAIVGERFANVRSYRQHPWLASVIEPAPNGKGATAPSRRQTRATTELDPGAETYSVIAASDGDLPDLDGLLALGSDFEVKWWSDRLQATELAARVKIDEVQREARESFQAAERLEENARKAIQLAEAEARKAIQSAEAKAREQIGATEARARDQVEIAEHKAQQRVEAVELESRRALAQAAELEAAAKARLRETATALLEANQSLAKLPTLQLRFDEIQALHAHIELLEESRSWRYMAPLRRIRHFFRRRTKT